LINIKYKLSAAFLSVILICLNFAAFSVKAESKLDMNKIDNYVKSRMKSEKILGASLGIVEGNKIIYLKGYGNADNKGAKVTEKTPFIIGSLSKSFTALAIMQLQEEGKIDIDAQVRKYLPWFKLKDENAAKKITIRNLLNHKSGLSHMKNYNEFLNDDIPLEEFIKSLKDTEITKPVGLEFQYSNIGYDILGEVVEKVSGMPYSKYIEKNIFKPLEMKNSYTSQSEAKKNGLATGYMSYFGIMCAYNQKNHTGNLPAGYLMSTSEDMAHYLIAQMNDGKYNQNFVVSKQALDEMHKKSAYMGYGEYYGMGWVNDSSYIWHNGESENFRSELFIDKSDDFGVVMFFNCNDNMKSYDYITKGVINILKGDNPANSSQISFRTIANIVGTIVIVLSIFSVYRLIRWIKKLRLRDIKIFYEIICVAVINMAFPAFMILYVLKYVCYKILSGPLVLMPDVVITIIFLPVFLIIIGAIKIIMLERYYKSLKLVKGSDLNV